MSQNYQNQFIGISSPLFNASQYITKQQSISYYSLLYFISYHYIRAGRLSQLQQKLIQLKQLQIILNLDSLLPQHDFQYGDVFPSSFCYESMKPPRFIGPTGIISRSTPIQKKKLFDIKQEIQDIMGVDQILYVFSPTILFKQAYAEYLNFYKLDSKYLLNHRFQRRVGFIEWRQIQEEFIKNAQDGDINFYQLDTNRFFKSFYASLVGYLPEIQPLCYSYHDYLWAYFKSVYYTALRKHYTKADKSILSESLIFDNSDSTNQYNRYSSSNINTNKTLYDSDGPDKYLHYSLVSFKNGTKIYDPNYDIENKMPAWFSMNIVKGLQALDSQVIKFNQASKLNSQHQRKYSSSPLYSQITDKSCYKQLQQILIKIFYRSIVLNEGVSVNVYTPLYKFVKEKVILEKIKFNQLKGGGFNHFSRLSCHLIIWMFVNHRLPNCCICYHDRIIQMYVGELIERVRYVIFQGDEVEEEEEKEEKEEKEEQFESRVYQEEKQQPKLHQSIIEIIPLYFNFILNHNSSIKMYSRYLILFINYQREVKLQRKRQIDGFLSEALKDKLFDGLNIQIQQAVQSNLKMINKQIDHLSVWDKIALQKLHWNERPEIFIKSIAQMIQKKQYQACDFVFTNYETIQQSIRSIASTQHIILINKLQIVLSVLKLTKDWQINEENAGEDQDLAITGQQFGNSQVFGRIAGDLSQDNLKNQTRELVVKIKDIVFPLGLDMKELISAEGINTLESSIIITYSLTKQMLYEPLIKFQSNILEYLIGVLCRILDGSDQLNQIGGWLQFDDISDSADDDDCDQIKDIREYKMRVREIFQRYGLFIERDDEGGDEYE